MASTRVDLRHFSFSNRSTGYVARPTAFPSLSNLVKAKAVTRLLDTVYLFVYVPDCLLQPPPLRYR